MVPAPRLFGYEDAYRDDLEFVPMAMRFRLDGAGLKIDLPTWQSLPVPIRFELAAMPAGAPEDFAAIRARLEQALGGSAGCGPLKRITVDPGEWGRRLPVPECVRIGCEALSAPMDDKLWLEMEALERYALVKLSRSSRQPEAFRRVLEEISARSGRHDRRGRRD